MSEYSLSKYLKFADMFTLGNAFFGFLAIIFFVRGDIHYGLVSMVISFVLDIVDGPIARQLGGGTPYGKVLDFADLISFGAAPGLLIVLTVPDAVGYASAMILVLAGLLRLARYAVVPDGLKIGVAITLNGILFPVLYVIMEYFSLSNYILAGAALISSLLMVSDLKV